MTPARMAAIHAAAFAAQGGIWSAADVAAMLDRPPIHAITMGEDGFALIQVIAPEAELLTIAIRPEAQGQGLGRRLLAEVFRAARMAGASALFLEVAADNAAARALYAAAGFTQTGHRRGYYMRADGPRVDALLLRRETSA